MSFNCLFGLIPFITIKVIDNLQLQKEKTSILLMKVKKSTVLVKHALSANLLQGNARPKYHMLYNIQLTVHLYKELQKSGFRNFHQTKINAGFTQI